MVFKKILVPLDGSPFAEKILPLVEHEAARSGSKVTLMRVITGARHMLPGSQPITHSPREMVYFFDPVMAEAMEYLKRVSRRLTSKGIAVDWAIQQGAGAGESIAGYATDEGIDLIIIATHGRGLLRRILSGSTTDYLLRKSGLPVLAVNPEERAGRLQSVRADPAGA